MIAPTGNGWIMGTVKDACLVACAPDPAPDPVVVRAAPKLTCAPVEVDSRREAQLSTNNVGGVEVPRAGAVVADGRVAEGLSIQEDLAFAGGGCGST